MTFFARKVPPPVAAKKPRRLLLRPKLFFSPAPNWVKVDLIEREGKGGEKKERKRLWK